MLKFQYMYYAYTCLYVFRDMWNTSVYVLPFTKSRCYVLTVFDFYEACNP